MSSDTSPIDHLSRDAKRAALAALLTANLNSGELFPLSFGQQRLLFFDQLEPHSGVYVVPIAVHLHGLLHAEVLQQSFQALMRRHEALRTTFSQHDGTPVQVVAPYCDMAFQIESLEDVPMPERESRLLARLKAEAGRPFDLAHGSLIRVLLLRLQPCEQILLVTIHHIVFDGWSLGVLFRELSALYTSAVSGVAASLPELPIQYADFAIWQREKLQGQTREAHLAYWRQQLAHAPSAIDLPTDRPRPPAQTFHGAHLTVVLPETLTQELTALSQREGATLFMTLLATFNILLSRYTRQSDIVVGVPSANRTRSELADLIGCFVNTLPIRTNLSGDLTFRALLRRVHEACLGAYAHQDLPFEQIVEELQPARDPSRSPLFQVLFVLQTPPLTSLNLSGLTANLVPIDNGTAKYELGLELFDTGQGLHTTVEYNTDLFDASTIARLLDHWQTLLSSIVADPDQRVGLLPFITAAEREQLLTTWNTTEIPYQDGCIHELFEAQVAQTPDRVAVQQGAVRLTYAELNARANQLAHHLRTLNVGPEVRVGLCLERSLELLVGLLGILKAGGAYVPLDPTYPPERLAFMLADADVSIIVTQQAERLPAHATRLLAIDINWPSIAQQSQDNPLRVTESLNLAYVIYTSGSTGRPKGVAVAHRAIVNRLLWMQDAYRLAPDDRVLQKTPYSFDVSVWEFFWPIIVGAQLVLARPEGHKDPAYLVELIAEQQITTVHFVPSMLQAFLEGHDLVRCHSLRRVICSGEALTPELQSRFFDRLHAELHNLYGPTEAAVDVTFWACERQLCSRTVPIGRPIANTQIYLLDDHLQPVPVGVLGELYIGGIGLARGYLGWPDLTAERFIPNPFSVIPGERLYCTGDLARYTPDGNIEYLGRIDQQVKLRGFRIELGEIEVALKRHPQVHEAIVLADEVAPGDTRLVAYVVPTSATSADLFGIVQPLRPNDLRRTLKTHLPIYMIPAAFILLDTFPLTPSGKLDRRALPPQDWRALEQDTSFIPPRTSLEQTVASIWADLLDIDQVGLYDNFFELGGHSLLATQVIARVRDACHIDLTIQILFEAPTLVSLAEEIRQMQNVRQGPASPPSIA
jgi:amino acid adenylation domain-containing protein